MKKKAFTWLFILIIFNGMMGTIQSYAQDVIWAKSIGNSGNDVGNAIAVDNQGNVYVTGYFDGNVDFDPGPGTEVINRVGAHDIFLAKYDVAGNYLWAKGIGGTGNDRGWGIALDKQGNVYITGEFAGTVDFDPGPNSANLTTYGVADIFIAKYDAAGNYLWAVKAGGTGADIANAIDVDENGNIYITGKFTGMANFNASGTANLTATGNTDIFFAKYNTNGQYVWAKNIAGEGIAIGTFRIEQEDSKSIRVDNRGNIYITGCFDGYSVDFDPGPGIAFLINSDTLSKDIFIAKYNTDGNYVWAKNIAGNALGPMEGRSLFVDDHYNVYVTGFYVYGVDFDPGPDTNLLNGTGYPADIFIAKYDSNANYIWAKGINGVGSLAYGGNDPSGSGADIVVDKSGNTYITGSFRNTVDFDPGMDSSVLKSNGTDDLFVAKYDPYGNYIWAKAMGATRADNGTAIALDASRNVYVTGNFRNTVDFNPGAGNPILLTGAGNNAEVFFLKIEGCADKSILTSSYCDSFRLNNKTYYASGTYMDTLKNMLGCDSVLTLNLTINKTTLNPGITGHYCDSVTFNSETYLSSGVYTQYYTNSTGCDSNIVYDLTIGRSYSNKISETACDRFEIGDTVFTVTGQYLLTFQSETECDSLVFLDLIVNSAKATIARAGSTLTANSADSYQWINCSENTLIQGATDRSYTATENGSYAVIISNNNCADTSDCIVIEGITGIDRVNGDYKLIRLYPNPAEHSIIIESENMLYNADIRLLNVVGQSLLELTGQNGKLFSLDLSPYAKGIYFVEIGENGKVTKLKMIKE